MNLDLIAIQAPAGCIVRVDRIAPGTWPYCEDVAEVTFIDGSPYNYPNGSRGNYLAKELTEIECTREKTA